MLNYDFLVLSPSEFENISRDLLQKKYEIFIESFTTGKDGGVDLRFAKQTEINNIIQAKRYNSFPSLLTHLKKEVLKVRKLNPDSYILTTSVGLTPANKTEIIKLFHPYIKQTEDIFGRNDLNNLLGIFKEIENQYYKLWLSSSNVLQRIVHSRIYNQSAFELETIKEQVKLYVQNDSFGQGLSILKKHRYLIISGLPGIGKTTLARIIVLYLLSKYFDEFIYLSEIDDAHDAYDEGKKQIFFLDDFLGKIRFDAKKLEGEDEKIVKFIEKIRKTKNKLLILATREYILSQARGVFESFNISNIEVAKCILDISSYTKIIKAQIIYNHLFFADVPHSHLEDLVRNKNYLKLVNHRNYNPRIIETVIHNKIWINCSPDNFSKLFKSYFDNPESVWKHSFENSLNSLSQYVLLVLLNLGSPVLLKDLERAVREFVVKNHYIFNTAFDSIIFLKSIKDLENTFILTLKDSYENIIVEFQNPSIQDFLINYLRNKEELISSLLNSVIFCNQFFTLFTTSQLVDASKMRRISLSSIQVDLVINRVKEIFASLQTSELQKQIFFKSDKFKWIKPESFLYSFLYNLHSELKNGSEEGLNYVYDIFRRNILINTSSYLEQRAYVNLLKEMDLKLLKVNETDVINNFIGKIEYIENLNLFYEFIGIFTETFNSVIESNNFIDRAFEIVKDSIESVENDDLTNLIDEIKDLEKKYSFGLEEEVSSLERKASEYNDYLEMQAEDYEYGGDSNQSAGLSEREQDEAVGEIFNSLLE